MFATNNNNTGNMFGSNMFSSSKNPFESKKPETLGNSGQPSNIFATSGNTNMFGGSGNNGNSGTMFGGSGNTGTMFGNPGNSTPENKNIFGQSIGQPMFTKNDQG